MRRDKAPSSQEVIGFLESAAFKKDVLRLVGWALSKMDGEPPDIFHIRWGNSQFDVPPNTERPDATRTLGYGNEDCGIRFEMPLPSDVTSDWTDLAVTANWNDGRSFELPKVSSFSHTELSIFNFSTFEEFQSLYQNPAFRIKDPVLQAYGAARALKLAGNDRGFWLAASIVALYRCFEDDIFPRSEAESLIAQWKTMSPEMDANASGILLRWATSMHLAAGYAHLAWSEYELAREEFTAVAQYADRIKTWPQAVTNIGIAIFIGAWLEWREGHIEAAKAVLAPADSMFQTGVGVLKIWNWHMYEELRGALKITQMCFAFLKRLENEQRPYIVPPTLVLKLSHASVVMERLIERGLVPDEALPA